jgi:O-ureido-D-serine cyclo-ligase
VTSRIALVTAEQARAEDEDLLPLVEALAPLVEQVDTPNWDDTSIEWSGFDLVVLRSTWDYVERHLEFLSWIDSVTKVSRLVNPAPVVRWNTDKRYFRDLAAAGINVVESAFAATPQEWAAYALPTDRQFVVKPTVSAGSRDTQRFRPSDVVAARAHGDALVARGRPIMVQPYQEAVDHEGETALFYFAGVFSHSINKGPLLRLDEGPTRALFSPETITPNTPTQEQIELGYSVISALNAVPALGGVRHPLTYARVDVLTDNGGEQALLELELTEPSLFFSAAPGAADRFAAVLAAEVQRYS